MGYIAFEVKLFGVSGDAEEIAEKVREAVEAAADPDFDGEVEIDIAEHSGIDCAECRSKSGKHSEA